MDREIDRCRDTQMQPEPSRASASLSLSLSLSHTHTHTHTNTLAIARTSEGFRKSVCRRTPSPPALATIFGLDGLMSRSRTAAPEWSLGMRKASFLARTSTPINAPPPPARTMEALSRSQVRAVAGPREAPLEDVAYGTCHVCVYIFVCLYMCVCARARARACVRA
jgi:hypothetical protein